MFTDSVHVNNVRSKESLRFRDKSGRYVKFDGRKKLVAELWQYGKKTNRVLNKTKKKKPVPQKFEPRLIKRRLLFLEQSRRGVRKAAKVSTQQIKIDARFSIVDNLIAKDKNMASDCINFTRKGNAMYVSMEWRATNEEGQIVTLTSDGYFKFLSKAPFYLEIARYIIWRMYRNMNRMSNIKKSPLGKRARYVRAISVRFNWSETLRTQAM